MEQKINISDLVSSLKPEQKKEKDFVELVEKDRNKKIMSVSKK